VAAVFSYSKTKGLFAGVSLEGSMLIERKDANAKLYGSRVSASQLLTGTVRSPPQADALMRVLNSRAFQSGAGRVYGDSMYNDIPVYDSSHDDVVWEGRRGAAYGQGQRSRSNTYGDDEYSSRDRPSRSNTWTDDVYDRPAGGLARSNTTRAPQGDAWGDNYGRNRSNTGPYEDDYSYSDRKPSRPTAPKPAFGQRTGQGLRSDQAVALYTFDADQEGDLGFKKGEIITILKRTEKAEDWWTGRIGDRVGIFPR
jgi:hypothetical protein